MQIAYCKWFTSESSGWLRFLADGFIGLLWLPLRLVSASWWIAWGVVLADGLNRLFGLSRWIGGPLSLSFVLLVVWASSLGRLLVFFPFPPCRRGQCRDIDAYTWVKGRIYGREKWGMYHYWCKCGDEYIREGKRFLQVLPDGTRQAYMALVGFRKWQLEPAYQDRTGGC